MTKSDLLKTAKPILFNTEMVQAILDGRKTVTRRVIKPQPNIELVTVSPTYYSPNEIRNYVNFSDENQENCKTYYPKYNKGDILYVRETAMIQSMKNFEKSVKLLFRADDRLQEFKVSDVLYEKLSNYSQAKWLSPYYLTKEVARIFLKVTDMRVERLQDITKDYSNFNKEGIKEEHGFRSEMHRDFIELWNSTVKKQDLDKYSWKANPWVWVYEFERIKV